MKSRKSSTRNQRNRRSGQNILEVSVRSQLANQQRNRMILRWTSKVIAVVGLVSAGVYGVREGLRHFLWENPEYNLAVVEINNDGSGLTREVILTAAGLQLGENIFNVSLAAARDALADLPQVEHVELRRVLPQKISIDVAERRPVAWLAAGEALDPSTSEASFLVDAKGVLFKPKRLLPEYLRLPVIVGVQIENFLAGEVVRLPEAQAALDLIHQSGDSGRFQIQSINLSKGYCMVVTDIQKKQIVFPLDDIEWQLERLAAVLDYGNANRKEIQTVNLMVERNIPITEVPYGAPAENAKIAENVDAHDGKDVTKTPETAKVPTPAKASSVASARSTTTTKSTKTTKPSTPKVTTPSKANSKPTSTKNTRQEELRKVFSR